MDNDEKEKQKRQEKIQAQIARNNEWIEKMSPVVKYKIQEYVRKQRAKKQQRRKFSIALGLPNRIQKVVETKTFVEPRPKVKVSKEKEPTTSKKSSEDGKKKKKNEQLDMASLEDLE